MQRLRGPLVLVAAGALLLTSAGPVGAGESATQLEVFAQPFLPLDREVPRFQIEVDTDGDQDCADSLALEVVDEGGDPVEGASIDEALVLTFDPTAPGGFYAVVATCESADENDLEETADVAFARGIVEKVVVGDVPDDATFTVQVDCEGEGDVVEEPIEEASIAGVPGQGDPFVLEFDYGPDGGEELFVVYGEQGCEVTETEDGGADDVEVSGGAGDDGAFSFPDAIDETVTVTNTFAGAEPRAEPPAALPEQAAPDFTG